MPRPKKPRRLYFCPRVYYFKPRGVPMRMLSEEVLNKDEVEVIKLHDVDNMDQRQVSEKMGVSQPTVARILKSAHTKIAKAVIGGKAIRFENGV